MIQGHLRVAFLLSRVSSVAVLDGFEAMGARPLNGNEAQHG